MAAHQKFTGTSDVEDFLQQLDAIAVINGWNDEQKRYTISAYLDGPALQWYKANVNTLTTYAVIKEKIREEFPSQLDYAQVFYYRRQGVAETLLTYFYELQNLAAKANITDDMKFVKHFLKSINARFQGYMASRLYASKEELKRTIMQMEDVFNPDMGSKLQGVELPVKLSKDHLTHIYAQGDATPSAVRRQTPQSEYDTPQTPATAVGPQGAHQSTSYTPYGRYNLRPRQVYQQQPMFQGNRDTAPQSGPSGNYQQRRGYQSATAQPGRSYPNVPPRR